MFLWPVSEPPRNEKSPFFTFYLLNSTLQKVVQKTEQKKALCDVTNGPDTSPRLMTTPAATVFIPWFNSETNKLFSRGIFSRKLIVKGCDTKVKIQGLKKKKKSHKLYSCGEVT